jgi:hypothetical protein
MEWVPGVGALFAAGTTDLLRAPLNEDLIYFIYNFTESKSQK